MPNALQESIHHGETAENAEFAPVDSTHRGDSIIQMNQDTSFDPDNENLRLQGAQNPPPGFMEEQSDTIRRVDDDHVDDVEGNF